MDKSGTGEVASMRAGLRMMGSVMGGTPTCSGEVSGCRISGGWASGGGPSGEGLEATGDVGELLLGARVPSGFSESVREVKAVAVRLPSGLLKPLSFPTPLSQVKLLETSS